MEKRKNSIIILFAMIIFFSILTIPVKSIATTTSEEEQNYTEEYKWYLTLSDEEKSKLEFVPRKYEYTIEQYKKDIAEEENSSAITATETIQKMLYYKTTFLQSPSAILPASYCLLSSEDSFNKLGYTMYGQGNLNLQVDDQNPLGVCWIFAPIKTIETVIQKKYGLQYDFSERYIDFKCSRVEYGDDYWRELGGGGSFSILIDYFTTFGGKGLVQESSFEGNDYMLYTAFDSQGLGYCTDTAAAKTKLANTNVEDIYVTDFYRFPTITKDENNQIDTEELNVRNDIKEFIMNNGAVSTSVNMDTENYWNAINSALFQDGNQDGAMPNAHAIAIVGWDDTYPMQNFGLYNTYQSYGIDPTTKMSDGAWICQNSWGTEACMNGYFFVSYNDYYVERDIMGVKIEDIYLGSECDSITFTSQDIYNLAVSKLGDKIVSKNDSTYTVLIPKTLSMDLDGTTLEISAAVTPTDLDSLKKLLKVFNNLAKVEFTNTTITNISGLGDLTGLEDVSFVKKDVIAISSNKVYQTLKNNMSSSIITDLGNNQLRIDGFTFWNNISLVNGGFTTSDITQIIESLQAYQIGTLDLSNNSIEDPTSLLATTNCGQILLANQSLSISGNTTTQVALPQLFVLALQEGSKIYSQTGLAVANGSVANNFISITDLDESTIISINTGNAAGSIFNISNVEAAFIGTVRYSTTSYTNQGVTVTIEASKELTELAGWTLSADKFSITKTYTRNINEEVQITNTKGERLSKQVIITNIDTTLPTATLSKSGDKAIKVEIADTESGVKQLIGVWSPSNTQQPTEAQMAVITAENGIATVNIPTSATAGIYYLWVQAEDNAGNKTIKCSTDSVTIIDFSAEVGYSTMNYTNQSVTVTIQANKELAELTGWTLSTDKLKLTKAYTQNTNEQVEINSIDGEQLSKPVIITNIDAILPTLTLSNVEITRVKVQGGDTESGIQSILGAWNKSNSEAPAISEMEEISLVQGQSIIDLNTTDSGIYYYWVKITDKAGNTVTKYSEPIIIASKPATLTVTYSNTKVTNKPVEVTIKSETELKALEGWTLSTEKLKLTKTYTQNVKETITVTDINDNTIEKQIEIINIDTTKPTVLLKCSMSGSKYSISVEAADGESEIKEVYVAWTTSNIEEPDESSMEKVEIIDGKIAVTIPENLTNGTYYLWVKATDIAENVTLNCSEDPIVIEKTEQSNSENSENGQNNIKTEENLQSVLEENKKIDSTVSQNNYPQTGLKYTIVIIGILIIIECGIAMYYKNRLDKFKSL